MTFLKLFASAFVITLFAVMCFAHNKRVSSFLIPLLCVTGAAFIVAQIWVIFPSN